MFNFSNLLLVYTFSTTPNVICYSTETTHFLQVETKLVPDNNRGLVGELKIKNVFIANENSISTQVRTILHSKENDETNEYFYEYWTPLQELTPTMTVIASAENPGKEIPGTLLKGSIFYNNKNIELECQTVQTN